MKEILSSPKPKKISITYIKSTCTILGAIPGFTDAHAGTSSSKNHLKEPTALKYKNRPKQARIRT